MASNNYLITDTRKVKLLVIQFLKDLVQNARGQVVTFRPAKVAQEIAFKTRRSPRAESVIIRNFFEELVEHRLIHVIKKSARGKVYGLYRDSFLWRVLETYEPHYVLSIIEESIRGQREFSNEIFNLNNISKINLTISQLNDKF